MSIVKIFQIISITITTGFVLYLVCRGKKRQGLSYQQVIGGLGLKVILGAIYGYVFLKYYNGDDTWYFFNESLPQTKLFLSDPGTFFRELGPASAFRGSTGILPAIVTYLGDLELWIQVKLLALFNLVTFSDYYLDMCLLNGLFFFGHYFLYKLIVSRYDHKLVAFSVAFCFAPAVFWLSGIRPDGYLFLFISLSLFSLNRILKTGSRTDYAALLVGVAGTLIFRPPYAALLLPSLIVWALIEKGHRRPGLAFFGVYGICFLLFFGSSLFSKTGGLPGLVVARQQAFFELKANTRYPLDTLETEPVSFLRLSPQAINNSIFRPYLWEAKGLLQIMSAMENLVVLILVIFFSMKIARQKLWYSDGLLIAILGFAVLAYLFTGLTVPFPGAIVRYRAIPELLLLAVMAGSAFKTYNN